jgi:spore coat protein CotH
MKLAKYDEATGTMHGMLWKSKDWSYAVFMGHNSNSNSYPGTAPRNYDNNSESWDQYYVKYPDFDDVRPTDWQTLYNAVKFVCTSSDNDFRNHVAEYFDLPLLTDYYILMETILSTDNHGKNMFFACYDQQESPMVTFGVWDMDATIGQRWSDAYYHSNLMQPEQDYATYITNNEHGDYNLFRRLRLTNAEDFNMRVRLRYKELRQNWLSTESILNRFRQQLAEFKTAGADKREYAKWSGDSDVANKTLNFDTELNYIENWVTRRMNYLDTKRFKISELSGIIETADTTTAADQYWYTPDGCRLSAQPTAKGLYIHGGRKVLVK